MFHFNHSSSEQRRSLHQSQLYATILLLLALGLFIISCLYQHLHPAMTYLKAFAEAAMVGGLADWFAITALFHHPLGLPIPHTAILVHKQNKIAEGLGRFIEHNFLQGQTIASRIYQWHPTQKVLNWLSQPRHQQQWLPLILQPLPAFMRRINAEHMAHGLGLLLDQQCSGAKLGTTVANLCALLRQQQLDTQLVRILLYQIQQCLHNPQTRAVLETNLLAWASKIETEEPSTWDKLKASFKITLTARMDHWVATKILDWANTYITEALNNPQHALWRHYRHRTLLMERKLRYNPHWHQRLSALRHQLVQSDVFIPSIESLWQQLIHWSEHDLQQPHSWWQQQGHHFINYILSQFHAHPQLITRLDARMALWVKHLIEHNKHHATHFVATKVKSWNSTQIIDKIELNIGRDLQFIRINGTLVGGMIGLAIHTLSQLLSF